MKALFPQMNIPDIINALAGWGLSVSPDQLKNPSSEFVEGVYCACLQQVTDLNHDALREPAQSALNAPQLEDQDLYATALTSNIVLYHLTRFAKAARVQDFNSKDIYSPEKERTLILLSAFINFVKFTEQFCDTFLKELRERSDTLMVQRGKVGDTLRNVEDKIDDLKAKIAQDRPVCEKLEKENLGLTESLYLNQETFKKTAAHLKELKSERQELTDRKNALNGEIKSVEETIERTRSRIVQSPERIKRTIDSMKTDASELKNTVSMHEAKTRDLQAKINALHNIEKDVRACIEQLQTIEREVQSLQVSQKELGEQKDHLDEKHIEKNELRLRQERVGDQLANAQDKLDRAQKHAMEKKIASQKTTERLRREYEEMVVERRENDKQIEEVREEADEIDAKLGDHLRKSEAELNELLAEYWKLRHETDVYMETLANKLNMKVIAE